MIFLNNLGKRPEKKPVYKKIILSGLLAVIFLSASIADFAAAGENSADYALGIAASLPRSIASAPRRSDIEEAAQAAISSVKGIAELMKQAHELSAMLPSTRHKTQAFPKSNLDAAMSVAARLPEPPKPQPAPLVANKPVTPDPKPSPAPKPANDPKQNPKPAQDPPKTSVAALPKIGLPGSQKLIWPVDGLIYSAFNATRGKRMHGAIDIVAPKGAPILAAGDGIVSVAANGGKNYAGYGKIIILDHGMGLYTVYAHCNSLLVKMGQHVRQGECIATVGRTGRATTEHCHFEVRMSGKKYDPLAYLPPRPEVLKATNYKSPKKN